MLPCTGVFKSINCPFYDSGLCERPYCHFKHVKKDSPETVPLASSSSVPEESDDMLQKLISDAVKKVIQQSDLNPDALSASDLEHSDLSQEALNKVLEDFSPPVLPEPPPSACYVSPSQASYKPTPIAELRKRHIPIPYSPSLMKGIKRHKKHSSKEFEGHKVPWQHTYIPSPMNPLSPTSSGDEIEAKFSSDESEVEEGDIRENSQHELDVHRSFVSSRDTKETTNYVPTAIQSLGASKYSVKLDSHVRRKYEDKKCPNDRSVAYSVEYKSTAEYIPQRTDKNVESSMESLYKPSTVSNIEPEYQPQCSANTVTEYHPTAKSELVNRVCEDSSDSISVEIDLLQELLVSDLKDELLPDDEKNEVNEAKESVHTDKHSKNNDKECPENKRQKSEHISEQKTKSQCHRNSAKMTESRDNKFELKSKYNKKSDKRDSNRERTRDRPRNPSETDHKQRSSPKNSSETLKKEDSEKKGSDHKSVKEGAVEKKSDKKNDDRKEKMDKKKEGTVHREREVHSSKRNGEENRSHRTKSHSKEDPHGHHKKHDSSRSSHHVHESSHSRSGDSKSSSKHKSTHEEIRDKNGSKKMKHDSSKVSSSGHVRDRKSDHSKHSKEHTDKRSNKSDSHHKTGNESSTREKNKTDKEVISTKEASTSAVKETDKKENERLPESYLSDDGSCSSDDVTKECLRMFEEYKPRKVTCAPEPTPVKEKEYLGTIEIGKKRVAHEAAQSISRRIIPEKRSAPNPRLVMAERYQKLQCLQPPPVCPPSSHLPSTSAGRVRVAHVSNVELLLNAKKKMESMKMGQTDRQPALPSIPTPMQTLPKGAQRIAHSTVQEPRIRHSILSEVGGKVPAHIRQNYFNLLASEYINLCQSEDEAQEKAVNEEKGIYNRSSSRQVYTNLILNRIQHIRREAAQRTSHTSTSPALRVPAVGNRTVSHSAILAGKPRSKGTWSIEKPKKLPEAALNIYHCFKKYILKEIQLRDNGFPRRHSELKGSAVVYAGYRGAADPNNPFKKTCDRCNKVYTVDSQGFPVKSEECLHHWGKLYNRKVNGSWREMYSCCSEGIGSTGCNHSDCHVSSYFDRSNLPGFVKTLPKEYEAADGDYGVYALDCEMCYTTMGLELTRVTVIDREFKTVYETLVKPKNPIIDYNTRFSGITEEQLKNVTTSIYDVQSALLSFISSRTILVGHSLDSDLKALKIIHSSVVDTSVVFPHRKGPPYKRALRTLCAEILSKTIQNSESGHDSAEDAKACMELMLWKIKEDGSTSVLAL